MLAPPEVDSIRAEIPATASLTYLNTGWQGPCPRSVIAAVQETFAMESAGPTAPPVNQERLDLFRAARRAMAGLINATPQEITLQQNTTEGINIVVSGLGLKPGDEVIICSMEHPSVVVPFYYSRERYGAKAKIVTLSAGDSDAEVLSRFEDAITPATRLIILSHVTYGSGQLLPIAAISRLAHERGGYVLLDAAQTVGQMPVDVRELDCDFCAFPGHKWLLGPAGTGALYVRRDLIERLEAPKVAHHAAHFYDFAGRFEPNRDTIDKFELTTVSVPLLAGLLAAVEFIEGIGVDAVLQRAVHLGRYATRRLARIPDLQLRQPRQRRGRRLRPRLVLPAQRARRSSDRLPVGARPHSGPHDPGRRLHAPIAPRLQHGGGSGCDRGHRGGAGAQRAAVRRVAQRRP